MHLVGRRSEELEKTAAEARAAGASAVEARPVDLTDAPAAEALYAEVVGAGALDILVHSAGVISLGSMKDSSLADFDAQWQANVRAAYALTKACLPALRAAEGQVAFINSSAALNARAGVGQFAATEAAVKAVADSLRDEVNADGVRVLSVFPGRTATPRQERIHAGEGRDYQPDRLMQPSDVATMLLAALELPRTAEVTDISMRPLLKPR
jgi:NADP-dependent 3-hydroxy acid dehydrogenase YdfG